ncbi:hypothetical protein, partial [Burkholderia semiarida]|uniref:hypothetical protein n=1 Tax=Burkholderia semiarida TaxID=2843303 RepID=UPI0023DDD6BF
EHGCRVLVTVDVDRSNGQQPVNRRGQRDRFVIDRDRAGCHVAVNGPGKQHGQHHESVEQYGIRLWFALNWAVRRRHDGRELVDEHGCRVLVTVDVDRSNGQQPVNRRGQRDRFVIDRDRAGCHVAV